VSLADSGSILLIAVGTALAAIWAGWTAVFLHGRLNSIVDLRVSPTWSTRDPQLVRIAVEVENIGEMRAGIEKILLAVVPRQIVTHAQEGTCVGNEWVDFGQADQILQSTQWILRSETIHVERLYNAGTGKVLHVGIQVHLKYPWYVELLGSRFRTRRQTRTFYLANVF